MSRCEHKLLTSVSPPVDVVPTETAWVPSSMQDANVIAFSSQFSVFDR